MCLSYRVIVQGGEDMRKKRFKPVITRVKLNPEQAVLQCDCWTGSGYITEDNSGDYTGGVCSASDPRHDACFYNSHTTSEGRS